MPTVLVTGGTGFVGRRLVKILCEQGDDVTCLVRKSSNVSELESLNVRIVTGDLEDPASIKGITDGIETVYHTACSDQHTFAHAGNSTERFVRVNVDGSVNLGREALASNVRSFVHVSSTAAMGTPVEVEVDETSPCNPSAPNQISKYKAEQAMLHLWHNEGLPVKIVRSCLVLGPGRDKAEVREMFRLIKKRIFPILGWKMDQRKPLIYLDDLVHALILTARKGRPGEIYLVTSGRPYSLRELVKNLERIVGRTCGHIHIPYLPLYLIAGLLELAGKVFPLTPPFTRARLKLFHADRIININKAITELDYKPQTTDLEQMLRLTYDWYKQAGLV